MERTRFSKDVICEFMPPTTRTRVDRVIIYCMGLPSNPFKKKLTDYLSKQGFWVFIPRYRGTWESRGEFLKYEPTKDIKEVIDGIFNGFFDIPFSSSQKAKSYKLKPNSLILIGSSFGGSAVLLNSKDPRVSKVLCLSPVVDWTTPGREERAEWFWPYLSEAFGDAFRFKNSNVKKLYKSKFYNPVKQLDRIDGKKTLIIHAMDDEVVTFEPVEKLAKQIGCEMVKLKKGGHLNSKILIKGKLKNKIINFIKKS